MTRVKVNGGEYERFATLKVGALPSVPINSTEGDLTSLRLHVGTDASFTANIGFELTSIRAKQGGTISSADSGVYGFSLIPTFSGVGTQPRGLQISPTFSGDVAIVGCYGLVFQPVFAPPVARTYANIYGIYAQLDYADAAGAVTVGISFFVGSPIIRGALKPANHYGLYVADQGAASIAKAVGIAIAKPTNATANYYMEFDVADATAAGAYHGRIPVLYNGLLKYIHIFSA